MKSRLLSIFALGWLLAGCRLIAPSPDQGALLIAFTGGSSSGWPAISDALGTRNARATFFVGGRIDHNLAYQLDSLVCAGHSIGFRGLRQLDPVTQMPTVGGQTLYQNEIIPQLFGCAEFSIYPRSYLYPTERHTEDTDAFLLSKHIGYLVTPVDGSALGDLPTVSFANGEVPRILPAIRYSRAVKEKLERTMNLCAERHETMLILFENLDMTTYEPGSAAHVLFALLDQAVSLGLPIIGINDLP